MLCAFGAKVPPPPTHPTPLPPEAGAWPDVVNGLRPWSSSPRRRSVRPTFLVGMMLQIRGWSGSLIPVDGPAACFGLLCFALLCFALLCFACFALLASLLAFLRFASLRFALLACFGCFACVVLLCFAWLGLACLVLLAGSSNLGCLIPLLPTDS